MTRQNDTPLSASQADRKASSACKAEGAFPYEDIVNTPWPPVPAGGAVSADAAIKAAGALSANEFREHMPLDDRAKIFAPFAALKGFNEAIEARTAAASHNDEQYKEDN